MNRFVPGNAGIFRKGGRQYPVNPDGQRCLGPDEVDRSQEEIGIGKVLAGRPEDIGKCSQDADDLPAFRIIEFPDLVVGLQDIGRLKVNRMTGSRLIVN